VLGGRVVAELNQSGQKQKGYVFVNGQLLAEQSNNWVTWHHDNPLTGRLGVSGSNGGFDAKTEPDPLGVKVGFHDPNIFASPPDDRSMPFLPEQKSA
jgi:hypothetical protein